MIERLKQLHAAWERADEAYKPGAVDDCARADELAEAVNALFDPMAEALPAFIECAERLAGIVNTPDDEWITTEQCDAARAALAKLKEIPHG